MVARRSPPTTKVRARQALSVQDCLGSRPGADRRDGTQSRRECGAGKTEARCLAGSADIHLFFRVITALKVIDPFLGAEIRRNR